MNSKIIDRMRPTSPEVDPAWSAAAMAAATGGVQPTRAPSSRRRFAVAGIAALSGLFVAGGVAVAATGGMPFQSDTVRQLPVNPPASPQPEATLTAGDWTKNDVPPDLVEGETDDGEPGFMRAYDLANLPEPDSSGDIVVNVYAKDGRTVIGHFTAAHFNEENEEQR